HLAQAREIAVGETMSLNTQRVRQYAAIVQIIAGGLALILVIGGYVRYDPRVRVAIHEADKLAGNLNEEIKDAISILTHVNESVSTVRASVPPLTQTLASTTDAVGKVAGTINGFSADSDSLADVCNRTSAVCETFEKQLPIKVPAVTLTTKTVSFNVPDVIPKTKPMSISYPTATAHTGHKDLRYPSDAKVKMGHVHVAGHSIDYPDGLDVSFGNAGLDYPDRLDIGNGSVVVERNLTVDPSHACSLRAGAALLPYPPTCCRLCRSFRL